ncbi:MAG: carbohydrate ABC transporter permease [Lachnospiraceae bacterium]|nr:carbohydrate ABC transporter permease [Lachnospiraceae bacterium]
MTNKKMSPVITILLLLLCVIMLIPFAVMLSTSLKSMQEIYSRGGVMHFFIPKEVHWENFIDAFKFGGANWLKYFGNSLLVTVVTILVSLCINSMAGYAFARLNFRGRDVLFFASLVGMMIPPQATIVPVFFILRHFPLAGGNSILGQGGTGFINTHFALVAPYLAGAYGVFLFRQHFLNFPKSLDDAATVDGLGRFGIFVRIYIPLSKPIFATLMTTKAIQCWNDYTWPLIVTSSEEMRTLQVALVLFKDAVTTQWNYLMVVTCIIILPLLILFFVAQKSFVEGIVSSGIKG